jgi:hypothetical protein
MVLLDDRILEFLAEYGNHQPAQITDRLVEIGAGMDYHPKYVGRRCRALADLGLALNVGNGVYTITDEGRAYLAGELDASTLSSE